MNFSNEYVNDKSIFIGQYQNSEFALLSNKIKFNIFNRNQDSALNEFTYFKD